jgi:hypothetical protein
MQFESQETPVYSPPNLVNCLVGLLDRRIKDIQGLAGSWGKDIGEIWENP